MKTTSGRIGLFLLLLLPISASARPKSLETQALETMKTATQYMMDVVGYRGGFVWNYLPDLSRQWGEMEAKRTMVWTQDPGTPQMGQLLLDAYHATGDEYYYEAAKQVAQALIWGQHESGGWNYTFDFAGEASLKDWYATVGRSGTITATPPSTIPAPRSARNSCCASMPRNTILRCVPRSTRPSVSCWTASIPTAAGRSAGR